MTGQTQRCRDPRPTSLPDEQNSNAWRSADSSGLGSVRAKLPQKRDVSPEARSCRSFERLL